MKRNSNIELLRLLLMWIILVHHFLLHNSENLNSYFTGIELNIVSAVFLCSGKPAVLLFFIITVWFYSDKAISVNSVLYKIRSLSNNLLFYSIPLGAISMAIAQEGLAANLVAQLFPLLTSTWWFPTSYALLLLTLPAAMPGLNRLSEKELGLLAAVSFSLNSILKNIPLVTIEPLQTDGLLGIIFILPLIVLIKKVYTREGGLLHNNQILVIFLITAYCANMAIIAIHDSDFIIFSTNIDRLYLSLIYDACSPTSVFISFSTFLLFQNQKPTNNLAINRLSKSAFSIYLLTDHPITRMLLWKRAFPLTVLDQFPNKTLGLMLISIGIFIISIIIDQVYRLPIEQFVTKHMHRFHQSGLSRKLV